MRVVVETKTGLQIEVIIREHSKADPDRTCEVEATATQAKALAAAITKAIDKQKSSDD